ncbi:MAG: transposase [Candidatus Accumulibacter sp.]|nr:transposase [Accumulibacter sp.]
MPQSLSRVIVHLVFSTRNRQPLLVPGIRLSVRAYLATVPRDHDCVAYRVGGIEDHVHLAFALPRKNTIPALVETIDAASSKWIKQRFPAIENFVWQHGHGAFSIGASELEKLVRHIDRKSIIARKHFRKNIGFFG